MDFCEFSCNFYSKFSFQLLKKVWFDANIIIQLIVHVTPLVWRKINFQLNFFKLFFVLKLPHEAERMQFNGNRKSWGFIGGIIILAAALIFLGVFCTRSEENASPQQQQQNRQVRSNQERAKKQKRIQKKRKKMVSPKVASDEVSIAQNRTQEKLQNLVSPKVVFDEVPISSAISQLQQLSKELDPEQTGVEIVIDNTVDPAEKTVTMKAENLPLGAAIKYICKMTNLKYKIEADGVIVITP